ncbi:MAG: hypothetical protein QMD03_01805 [Syntrophales bacterium]|nr:hypothetical protein [Syntrophales bacterium]
MRMIVDKPYYNWIYVIPPDWYFPIAYQGNMLTQEEYLEHWGKWVILGEREKLDNRKTAGSVDSKRRQVRTCLLSFEKIKEILRQRK